MHKTAILLLVLLAGLFRASAQSDETNGYRLSLPDTFQMFKPTEVRYVTTLASVEGTVFDSIFNPKAYFISSNGYAWVIAVKQKNGYAVFDPFVISSAYADTSALDFSREDVNGKGNKELVIRWEFYAGHSGWENSMHERRGGIQIWDLDKIVRIMDFENYYSYQNWWTEYAEDTTDTIPYEVREVVDHGGEHICQSYSVKFAKRQVLIQQENNCPDQGEMNEYAVEDKGVYSYVFTKKGLVKQAIKKKGNPESSTGRSRVKKSKKGDWNIGF